MKAIILVTAILLAFSAESQSLKEALYSGKLKADTGAVIRKDDSLKIKENMAQKVAEDSLKKETIAVEKEKALAAGLDTTNIGKESPLPDAVTEEKAIPKDNNEIWKTFIDELTTTIKSEVVTSGKLKKGAYSVLIQYEINPDGQIHVNSVAADPQNSFLEGQIKERVILNAPQLNPVLGTNGKARTVAKKQLLSFVK